MIIICNPITEKIKPPLCFSDIGIVHLFHRSSKTKHGDQIENFHNHCHYESSMINFITTSVENSLEEKHF